MLRRVKRWSYLRRVTLLVQAYDVLLCIKKLVKSTTGFVTPRQRPLTYDRLLQNKNCSLVESPAFW